MGVNVLVSVVMPTYKVKYFEAALESVLKQTYSPLELIICDDSADEQIAAAVEQMRGSSLVAIRYFKNETRLGEHGSTARGVRLARGKYIKLLHDDDVLQPECIEELVAVMENDSSIAMASSRRSRIDEEGEPLPDILATCFPFACDVVLDGPELVSFLGEHTINFIGEPSCVLCRRDDLLEIGEQLMSLNGCPIHWVGDLALYAQLLQRGNLAFLSKPLTKFRVSTLQFSQQGRDQPRIGDKGHADFRQAIRDLGWFRAGEDNRFVRVAPITRLKTRVFKSVNLLAAILRATESGSVSLSSWLSARLPNEVQQTLIDQHLQAQGGGPRIAVMLLDRAGEPAAVERTLASLQNVNLYRNLDVRVFTPAVEDGALVGRLNLAIADLDGDWLVLVEAGVEFTSSGLLIAALDLMGAPDSCQAVYADEVMRLETGELGLSLRPDLNLDLLLSFPAAMSRHWLYRRVGFLELGGFAEEFDQAFELEYQLRLIETQGLGCAGHISEPLVISDALVLADNAHEKSAILRHLELRGYQARLIDYLPGRYRIAYGHASSPLVSIIIPTKDQLPMLQRCVESLLDKTSYQNYELLIVDNASETTEAREWLDGVEQMGEDKVRILRYPHPFNYSAINNLAAREARGEYLVLLNNDTAIISDSWLDELLNHAQRPEVGIVGAKLLLANGSIQHAGIVLGLRGSNRVCGPAQHPFVGEGMDAPGFMNRLQVDQNYSAVTAACLMIRKSIYEEVGGLDEESFKVSYNDVDLCLKVGDLGYLTVWTPHAVVMHEGSVSQKQVDPASLEAKHKRFVSEQNAMYEKWLPKLANDPAYNANLALNGPGFTLETNTDLTWRPLAWRPLPVVLAHNADPWGCGHYRIIKPHKAMRDEGLIDGAVSDRLLEPAELLRLSPDVVVYQRQTQQESLHNMERSRRFSAAFKVYELDDYLPNTPIKSAHRSMMSKDLVKLLRKGLGYVDRFVVSTPALANALSDFHSDIRIAENRLPLDWWGQLALAVNPSTKPRVGWAGGAGHQGDLELIADVVRDLAGEVDWVFFGMCPDKLRPYVAEYIPGIDIQLYPERLASLRLDLALAPLEDNLFNACKSNLRLLEYGICGYPVIASDIECYRGGLPVTLVKNRYRDWMEAIRTHLADRQALAARGLHLREVIARDWMLTGACLEDWRDAWLPD